ncbi:hypothetical protein BDY21DRAFT_386517 [Lineolata rhizophorae]|uniref:Uncharacterized protein n=1 Tax=Lineolata rhizophorae TaxID=578093 RepID=A0A6A6NYF4_9PEZI|nr:hypothetical protein BDY21DRAFT_386517 [Lineolata rhizophorae]
MLFAGLAREKSPARRVLVKKDPALETSRRLLRLAARRYGVVLKAMETVVEGADESLPSSYSLAHLFSLTEYDRLLYLSPPGLLLSSYPLDLLLAYAPPSPLAVLPASSAPQHPPDQPFSTSLLLLTPSAPTHARLLAARAARPQPDPSLLRSAFPSPALLTPALLSSLADGFAPLSDTSSLSRPEAGDEAGPGAEPFDPGRWRATRGWVRFAGDGGLPAPQVDAGWRARARWRPRGRDEGRVWEGLYEEFRERRAEVCGLDLEGWRRGVEARW